MGWPVVETAYSNSALAFDDSRVSCWTCHLGKPEPEGMPQ